MLMVLLIIKLKNHKMSEMYSAGKLDAIETIIEDMKCKKNSWSNTHMI